MIGEYVDLYDENKKLTGEKVFREKGKKSIVPKGRYTIVVLAFIKSSDGRLLVQKTSKRKSGVWAFPGGHVKSGQTSIQAIKEELFEEMKLEVNGPIRVFKTYKYENAFKDVYYIEQDINVNSLILQEDEVEKVEFLSIQEIQSLIDKDKFRKTNIDSFLDMVEVIHYE